MFGLNSLNDLDLKMVNCTQNDSINSEFKIYMKEIKPFILAYRLDKITKEEVKNAQVQLLNKLEISCCSDLKCSIDNESFDVEPFNYIYINDVFYFNIPNNSTVSRLRQNKTFIDNLSDVFLKVFDTLDEKKIFESIIKQPIEDNIYDINNELAEGILEESKILLGEISIRLSIWKNIFKMKDITDFSNLNDNNLEEYIDFHFPEVNEMTLFNSNDSIVQTLRIREIFELLSIDLEEYNSSSDYKLSFDNLFQNELIDAYEERKMIIKNQLWFHLKDKSIDEQGLFLRQLYIIEHLFDDFKLTTNYSSYNFNQIIKEELLKKFSTIIFDINNNEFVPYDLIEEINVKSLSSDQLLLVRKDEKLNSLSYFENRIDYILTELNKVEENTHFAKSTGYNLDINVQAEYKENFKFEVLDYNASKSNSPWLADTNEPSNEQKKKLGLSVEEIIKKYLESKPELYSQVENIAKSNEGEHYDIKYYHLIEKKIKYVECKYYNGYSFFISREEKNFADKFANQYEIWLVNKDSKIFCINDLNSLGELQVVNYRVNIRITDN